MSSLASTSHHWAFSAIAELIGIFLFITLISNSDNSVDAEATEIKIHATPNQDAIRFVDDGHGMDRATLEKMLSLGYCEKGEDKVGKYGNGFKSGR